jgi:sigma-B regulation protein RsbU (phosphoserine phosphatase)
VQFGDRRFGVMQLINRKANGRRSAFCEADLAAMQTFAASLALALSHLDLAGKLVADHLLKRDIQQAQTAQAALLPRPDPQAIVAGYSVPAQRLSGDFYDYIYKDGRLAFCVGDVAGKGIAAALMMSRIITLFRHLVADGACLEDIVTSLNEAILENVAGIYAPDSDHGYLVNCGHLPVILQTPHACISYPAQRVPLGVAAQCAADIRPAKFALKTGYLIVLTDGITESKTAQVPIDDAYLLTLFRQLYGVSARDFVARIASLFTSGQLRSHDDATLLVIHPPANDCHHSTND